ncbi:MAG TPA: hypothetical protein VGW98_07710 [Solirubrobacteraceae bacterium]|jgi:hypothetical protein|nr:hypothetical protein [Solirubrobacteraceae bacterium]
MTKKLVISFAPLLAIVAFAVMPAAAQAVPHWTVNGALATSEHTQITSWGTVTFRVVKGGTGAVTCKKADAGDIWNPVGGGAGLDSTVLFAYYECEGEGVCPVGDTLKVTSSALPWASELIEVAGVIRDETKAMHVAIECYEPGGKLAGSTSFVGSLKPRVVHGSSALHPGFEEFDPGSGELEVEGSKGAVTSKGEGEDKMLGFTEQELINAKPGPPPPPVKWWVEGKVLVGSEAIAEETKVVVPFKLELHAEGGKGPGFTILCKKVKVKGGAIEAPNVRTEKAVIYEECGVEGSPNNEDCVVETTETKPLKANLEGSAPAIKLKFEPTAGPLAEIAAYEVKQAPAKPACGVTLGKYTASGTMICNYNGVEAEKTEHALEFTAGSGSKVTASGPGVSGEAGFVVTDEVKLASGKMWSAF